MAPRTQAEPDPASLATDTSSTVDEFAPAITSAMESFDLNDPQPDQNANHPPIESAPFGSRLEDLEWIDQFVGRIHPYVRVRAEDNVLIKMPMEVFQLNPIGIRLLQQTLQGHSIRDVVATADAAEHPERLRAIHTFFCDIRDLLQNRIGTGAGRPTTHVTRFQGSFTRLPVLSEIAITYRCNMACAFCYAGCGTTDVAPGNAGGEPHRRSWRVWRDTALWHKWHAQRDPLREEMTAAEVRHVIDQIAHEGKVPSVSFTGGECTLRPELPAFIEHARRRGMRVNIITNGVRCRSRAYVDQLVEAGLTSAQVSLSGPTAAVHDTLARTPGVFAMTLRGIQNLRDAGLHVHTNTTINRANVAHLTEIIDLAHRLELPHVSMNMLIPTGTPNQPQHQQLRIRYSEIGPHVLRARDHAEHIGIGFHWYSPTPFCIFNPIAHGLGNKGCAACDGLLHVSPSGEVLPCSSFARGVGNLLEKSFTDVWFGKDACFYKRKRQAPSKCRNCQHFALCQGACALYWSGMGESELESEQDPVDAGRCGHCPHSAAHENRHPGA